MSVGFPDKVIHTIPQHENKDLRKIKDGFSTNFTLWFKSL